MYKRELVPPTSVFNTQVKNNGNKNMVQDTYFT